MGPVRREIRAEAMRRRLLIDHMTVTGMLSRVFALRWENAQFGVTRSLNSELIVIPLATASNPEVSWNGPPVLHGNQTGVQHCEPSLGTRYDRDESTVTSRARFAGVVHKAQSQRLCARRLIDRTVGRLRCARRSDRRSSRGGSPCPGIFPGDSARILAAG
jgi:hypothetical protein